MRICIAACVAGCLLSACTPKTPVETAFESVNKSLTSLERSLPDECRTKSVQAQIDAIKAQNTLAKSVCEADIKRIQTKYNRLWGVIILVLGAILTRFFLKK